MGHVKYIGAGEAADYLNLTDRRVTGLCRSGEIKDAVREGKKWMMPEEEVIAYARSRNTRGREDSAGLRPCAVGNTSYVDVIRDCYYVDKTLLIKELVDDKSMVTLFTRPRRFGKTLAMSMLKTFFERTEEDTALYFKDKKIWTCGKKYRELQGKFPVIFLSFKDVKYNNWADSMEAIRLVLRDEFRRHSELEHSEKLDGADCDFYQRMVRGTLSSVEYSRSLLYLTKMLAAHFGEQVIILIDEYDTPIQQGFIKGFYEDVITFMRNFLSGGLKDNDELLFGVLTGILRVSKENLFSGLNNLSVNTVLDTKYSDCFGFTENEVQGMADYYGKPEKMDEIRAWYDGYRFGSREIYNPWSVSSYFYNDCTAKNFWVNTSDNEILRNLMAAITPELAEELISLLQGRRVSTQINTEVIYPGLADGPDAVFSFLLLAGYLTPERAPEETDIGTFADLRLPNLEVRRVYNTEILSWIKGRTSPNAVSQVEKAIYLNDAERLKEALRNYMLTCASSFDGAAEGFYHGMVLGLVASLSSRYYIRSNRESGEGRFDLQLEPKQKSLPGVIMEFKAAGAKDAGRLPELAEKAIRQIEDHAYKTEMQQRGIEKIVCYGAAFSGKKVEIRVG